MMLRVLIIAIFALFPVFLHAKTIEVEGNKRIENNTIKNYFIAADLDDSDSLNKVLKRLYSSNLFSDVFLEISKEVITVKIKENPTIHTIKIAGNKALNDEVIMQEMDLSTRSIYTKAKLISDVNRLTEIYKRSGRVKVEITPYIKILKDNRIDLTLKVKEGNKTKIKKIYFNSNFSYKDKDLLKIISSKEARFYRGSSSFFDPDRVQYDKQLLQKFYLNKGYAAFDILDVKVEYINNINGFLVNYFLSEGSKYKFSKTSTKNFISQYQNIDIEELASLIDFKEGTLFSLDRIESTVDILLKRLNDEGFAFADIDYQISKDDIKKTVAVSFNIKKNKKIYIRNITILGNNRTEDRVIRRELKVRSGDIFNDTKIKRSRQRIQNLGFFESVKVRQNQVSGSNLVDITFEIAERSTGELNFGFGYSTTDKFLGNITVKERNLLGKGHSIALSTQRSSRSNDIDLSYTIPNFLDRDFSYSFSIFTINQELANNVANIKTQGFSNRISYEITEYLSQSLSYSLKNDEVSDVARTASSFLREQEGKFISSSISQSLGYDKRNNRLNPSKGYYIKLATNWTGVGGDIKFIKIEPSYVQYFPIYKDKVIFKTLVKSGAIKAYGGDKVRVNNRFFLGGSSFRGFRNAGIGPRDVDGSALGGEYYYKGTLELIFPLGLPEELGFKGILFSDNGSLIGNSEDSRGQIQDQHKLRASVGFGLAWRSPLGPISFNFANILKKAETDREETFRIDFGTRF